MVNLSNKTKIIITLIWVAILLVSGIVPMFPIINYNGQDIRLFAPSRAGTSFIFSKGFIRPQGLFWGEVMGTTVLDTEYGQITLNKHASIRSSHNTVNLIDVENFDKDLAFHNLVVENIKIPHKISVEFIDNKISDFVFYGQDAIVSGVPFSIVGYIVIYSDGELEDNANIRMRGTIIPDHIALADSTQLDVSQFGGRLYIYIDNGQWKLDCSSNFNFAAMRPGEAEYTRYKSITFEKDWGAFIEGELFEEQQ